MLGDKIRLIEAFSFSFCHFQLMQVAGCAGSQKQPDQVELKLIKKKW